MTTGTRFDHLVIIGTGLIGASIALDVRARGLIPTIHGIDTDAATLLHLRQQGVLDHASEALNAPLPLRTLLILATPPALFGAVTGFIVPFMAEDTILTDVGSVKEEAIRQVTAALPDASRYVPAHPIAGAATSGAMAARSDLFAGKRVVLCPHDTTAPEALEAVAAFWQALGAETGTMKAETHDVIYAHVSHLPQAVAYASMMTLTEFFLHPHPAHSEESVNRFLRLAQSSPSLWRDIFLTNRKAVLPAMRALQHIVRHFADELAVGEATDEASALSEETIFRLFPRVIASAVISTVQNAELTFSTRMAPYVGSGFADLTFPAQSAPEDDIAKISGHYRQVSGLLQEFLQHFGEILQAVEAEDGDLLLGVLNEAHRAAQHMGS